MNNCTEPRDLKPHSSKVAWLSTGLQGQCVWRREAYIEQRHRCTDKRSNCRAHTLDGWWVTWASVHIWCVLVVLLWLVLPALVLLLLPTTNHYRYQCQELQKQRHVSRACAEDMAQRTQRYIVIISITSSSINMIIIIISSSSSSSSSSSIVIIIIRNIIISLLAQRIRR